MAKMTKTICPKCKGSGSITKFLKTGKTEERACSKCDGHGLLAATGESIGWWPFSRPRKTDQDD